MKKFSKVAALMFGLAIAANAQVKGLGYDTDLGQLTARFGVGANYLDLGASMIYDGRDNVPDEAVLQVSGSLFFLGHLHDWGPVDTYFSVGGNVIKLPQDDDNISLTAFLGFQPEITLMEHLVLSTRFGFELPILPDVILRTAGRRISVVEGLNFKILF